jgi:imidazolonepropionase-like amidohydrolase
VLPGLVDLHVHLPPPGSFGEGRLHALLYLAHGVTSVRDTGSVRGASLRLADSGSRKAEVAPRVFACGPFLDGRRPQWPGSRRVASADEADAAIAELVERGARCAKLYNGLDGPTTRALIAAARRRELPVVAHVPRAASLADLAGAEVQHLMGATRCWSWLGPAEIQHYVDASREHGIAHTPTLVAFARRDGRDLAAFPAPLLPFAGALRSWEPVPAERCPDSPELRLERMRRLTLALHAGDVPIRVGTDTPLGGLLPGAALHAELAELAAAGLPTELALRAATRDAAEALGWPELGRIAPGAPADLALFRDDPSADLSALATLEAVVVRGTLYTKRDLDAAIAQASAQLAGPLPRAYAGAVHELARLVGLRN